MKDKREIAEELRLRLLEKGYLSADELNASGLDSTASLIMRWRTKKGMRIATERKGSVWKGRILEQTYYVLADNSDEWVPEELAEAVETKPEPPKQKDGKDKWKELKKYILQQKTYFFKRGSADSIDYKIMSIIEDVMGDLEIEEKGKACK